MLDNLVYLAARPTAPAWGLDPGQGMRQFL